MAFEAFLFAREVGVAILIFLVTYFSVRFLIVPHICRQIQKNHSTKKLPPGPKGWPFLGALPLLGTKPHVTLTNMARQYGPVMHLKMGPSHTVVASTSAGAKQFLKTLDHNFSNRPAITGANHLGYNAQDMVFLEYGPKWKLFKKLSTMHMLGSKALEDLGEVRASEVSHMVRGMHESSQKGEAINVGELLTCVITNIISQVILSRRIFESHKDLESKEYKEMVVEFMMISGVSPGDFVPTINWMDLQGLVARMKRLHKRFDAFLTKMVEGHLNSGRHHHRLKGKQDFLDVLLANSEDLSSDPRLNFTDIKALLLDMFTAGTDSSSSIITWAIAEMLKNPNILMKAQKEIDQMVGRERRIVESDLPKLPYLQAICKETYRLHPSTPLSIPRVSTEACEVDGYYIPKNTWLNVNIYAIGRDPDVWDNPLEFNPERFMSGKNANISPSGVDFELIPFGAGRRMCVGYKMAMVMIEYILGTLVHSFDWKLPNGSDLNMEEAFGITLHKAEPLFAMISPRLVPHAYA